MDVKIKRKVRGGFIHLSVVDDGLYVDAVATQILCELGLEDRVIHNEAILTEQEIARVIALFMAYEPPN